MRDKSSSRTAITVAKSIASIGAAPRWRDLVTPESLAFVRAALAAKGHSLYLRSLDFPVGRRALREFERLTIPGLALHHALRKRHIARRVEALLEGGCEEVIQIGAGLDPLCHELHRRWPEVRFREFDHPIAIRSKREFVDSFSPASNHLSFTELDPGRWDQIAIDSDSNRSRVLIVEGVTMYLSPEQVEALFTELARISGASAKLIFTFFGSGPGFVNQSPIVDPWLRLIGEPFLWWAEPQRVHERLKRCGWNAPDFTATWDDSEFDRTTIARGEWIAETTRQGGHPTPKAPL